jgi:hypothetical protein
VKYCSKTSWYDAKSKLSDVMLLYFIICIRKLNCMFRYCQHCEATRFRYKFMVYLC